MWLRMAYLNKDCHRYRCQNQQGDRSSFILDYSNHGYKLSVKQKIGEMVTNGSGICDTARVLNKACFDRNVRTKKAVRPW